MRTSSPGHTQVGTRLTLTEGAVLALLAIEGENSGYDLLKQMRKSIGHVWTPAKTQLYNVLPKLVRDGFASQRDVRQERRPDKVLYSITDGVQAALQSWLDTPDPWSRDAFYLRLFVGALADPGSLLDQVRQHREEIAGQLAVYREIEPTNTRRGHDAYHWFLLELAIEEYELKLRWADRVIASLEGQRA